VLEEIVHLLFIRFFVFQGCCFVPFSFVAASLDVNKYNRNSEGKAKIVAENTGKNDWSKQKIVGTAFFGIAFSDEKANSRHD
jgi:hypothetical protein